jgi:hypothetical protein
MAGTGQQDEDAVPTTAAQRQTLSTMARETQQRWCLVGKCYARRLTVSIAWRDGGWASWVPGFPDELQTEDPGLAKLARRY